MADTPSGAAPRGRTFVGRERERAELEAGLRDALAGHGRLCLIVGEAGIGKTRLASELHAVAVAAGARVRWARCWEGGGAPAFWPWTVLVRGVARGLDDAALAVALGTGAAQVAALATELRERLPDVPPLPATAAFDSEHARFPLFDAVSGFLRRAAEVVPLVLVLDDLHAADEASLLLLAFLARDLHDARLLVVGTQRELEAGADAEEARLLTGIARAGARLPLAGWDEAETGLFVAASCREPAPSGFVSQLHRLTEGNPFFVDEIVRLVLAEGGGHLPAAPSLRLPSSIRATITERLRPLSAAVRETLAAAAIIGREFDLAALRATAPRADDALPALAEAETAGVVVRRAGSLPRFAFAHALIREALYEGLAPAERAAGHRRVGVALERLYAADLGPQLDRIAHHFAQAAADGDAEKAVEYDVRAARRAAALLAYEEAARHLQRALQAHDLLAQPDAAAALGLRLELGEMQAASWAIASAKGTFRAAAAEARRLVRPADLARAALGFAGVGFGLPRGTVDAEIATLLEEALAGLPSAAALWARCAVRLAVELHFSADAARRDELSRAAVVTARAAGDDATLAYVLNARHFAVWNSAPFEERLALADEAVRLAEQIGEGELALQGRIWRLLDLEEIGDVQAFDREVETFTRLAEARRLPKFLGFAIALRGMRALWAGRFDEAVDCVQDAQALGERVGSRAAFMSVAVQVFVARRAQGRLAEIEPLVRVWGEQTPPLPAARCMLALTYAELDRADEARRVYESLAADDFVALQRRNGLHVLVPYLAEVCIYLSDTARAPILYRALLPYAGRNMGLGPNVCFGPATHGLARLAALLGQWDDAQRHFEQGLEDANRAEGPAWLAAIQYDYAAALLDDDPGNAPRAAELARAALATATSLGMQRVATRATALLERAGNTETMRAAAVASARGAGGDAERGGGVGREGTGGRVLRFPLKSAPRPGRPSGAQDGQFRCEGEYWTIGIGHDVVRLHGTSGLRYLAHLLRQPGHELPALTLAAVERSPDTPPATHAVADAAQSGLGFEEATAAHELLDEQARSAYKHELDDLRAELEEARGFNDLARVAALQREVEFLTRELARAVGLHGRSRPGSTRAERARLNVTRAIRSTLKRIAAANRDLGLYFETTIKTGAYCSYTPDPRLPVQWTF
ncbi:MAG: AAA family ATPase [bacterium]